MRVVVTRPLASAGRTAERLASMGHEPVLFPLTEARHHPAVAMEALERPHFAIAITSAEAIRCMRELGPELAPRRDEILFAVGEATADAAREAGFRSIQIGPGTGAELAAHIADTDSARRATSPLLYLAGKPRSPAFEEGLRHHSIPFVTTECYEMITVEPKDDRLLLEPPADAVLLYSRENANLFFGLDVVRQNAREFAGMVFCCMSENVAEAVPQAFRNDLRIARRPEEPSLLALL
ncbi:uroporphyrinogen-III synthase [Rhizobium sp. LCM 4573]|uniref:uroporphyrinogen-III synthase n=1 Tax=Rhizobium sp. LCM 4573 TaxID=1848291 RepID=UPI0008D9CD15|nr:uroporphyrinogen-III synthase [Rhizobium sp. LCM 4573]OHV82126.1 hypothetical protein LCM4573_19215 [Rhizobium sp. LCM 4573]